MTRIVFAALLVLLVGCGGGSGTRPNDPVGGGGGGGTDGGASTDGGGGGGLVANPGPQIALLISNGHSPIAPNYLDDATGPQLALALTAAGYTVETSYFVDAPANNGFDDGYAEFVTKLQTIRDNWIDGVSDPTRVVVVGHSHGCVRSHAAIRAVPDCPIRLLVDLDASSIGWTALSHGAENAAIGGAPEGAYPINGTILCPAFPAVLSAPGPWDLEDIVFDNVQEAYEVRSGDVVVDPANFPNFVQYDEHWNARPDGSQTGLTCHFSGTLHGEVALAGGVTMTAVQAWILARLAAP